MPTRFKIFAVVAALAAGTSSAAMAEYPCAPGYAVYGGVCRPVPSRVFEPGVGRCVRRGVRGQERLCHRRSRRGGRRRGYRHRYRHRQCVNGANGMWPWLYVL